VLRRTFGPQERSPEEVIRESDALPSEQEG
jgi:hypothetical protein